MTWEKWWISVMIWADYYKKYSKIFYSSAKKHWIQNFVDFTALFILLFLFLERENIKWYIDYFNYIPLPFLLLSITIYILASILYTLKRGLSRLKHIKNYHIHLYMWPVIILVFSIGNWYFLNSISYYKGMKRGIAYQARTLVQEFERRLNNGYEIENISDELFKDLPGKITIYKKKINEDDSKYVPIYSREKFSRYRMPDKYNLEKAEYKSSLEHQDKYLIATNKDEQFKLEYIYASSPKFIIGLTHAVTYSLFDFKDNIQYLGYRRIERSLNFWLYYLILFFIYSSIFPIICIFNDEKIKNSRELDIFKHTYNKIQKDFSRTVNDSRNSLQEVQSSWEMVQKKSTQLERHDIINAMRALRDYRLDCNNVKHIDSDRVHLYSDFINSFKKHYNFNIIDETYDIFFEPAINKIHGDLKGLENILDLELKKTNIQEIFKLFDKNANPKNIIPDSIHGIIFTKSISKNINLGLYANIILSKLESIIFNLIDNSRGAITNYKRQLRHEFGREREKAYVPTIQLAVCLDKIKDSDILSISVTDNAGGFPSDIIDDIYKKPIRSTKEGDRRKFGEATSYIGFFVSVMNGTVTAENVSIDSQLGARTTIILPLFR